MQERCTKIVTTLSRLLLYNQKLSLHGGELVSAFVFLLVTIVRALTSVIGVASYSSKESPMNILTIVTAVMYC